MEKIFKGKIYCISSAILIFLTYISQRILNICFGADEKLLLAEAFAYSLFTLIVYLLLIKSEDYFYGILISCFGIRLMPPDIFASLSEVSKGAGMLYFIVSKVSVVIFAMAIIKLYERQEKPRMIKPIPILAIILVVPFANEIQSALHNFLLELAETRLYSYFSDFAIYTAAMLVLLFIGTRCSKQSARLIAYFQINALALNASRKICAIVINLIRHTHISASYYCWIVIYAFFIVAFVLLLKKRNALKV